MVTLKEKSGDDLNLKHALGTMNICSFVYQTVVEIFQSGLTDK